MGLRKYTWGNLLEIQLVPAASYVPVPAQAATSQQPMTSLWDVLGRGVRISHHHSGLLDLAKPGPAMTLVP